MLNRSIVALAAATCIAAGLQGIAHAADENGVIRYSATTTNMQPENVSMRFDILRWSDEAARAAVVQALESEDVSDALDDLPTVGYIWPEGSPVGYSLKYAHSTATDSGERLTFVTSRLLGSYDFGGWNVPGYSPEAPLEYSVVELDLSDDGTSGTASLAAAVTVDSATVGLARSADTAVLFRDIHRLDLGR